MTIHILHHGITLCFAADIHRVWPEGDQWVNVGDADSATCEKCVRYFQLGAANEVSEQYAGAFQRMADNPVDHSVRSDRSDERSRATITALKIALAQAAETIEDWVEESRLSRLNDLFLTPDQREWHTAQVSRYRAMAAPDWSALPIDLNGPTGES